ncbi:hypothetical protein PR202_gb18319 [Eleusine coracana subsp. coracana]|uniref:DUF7769 domain-containing protein n=1 Tax=Eleusine coracana subsp. coracana TaxID=191504 RepID=A0AAV5F6U1_ELECO|nr:hypothetical protein PR202_gb18319 [Eleusine coracana subsp. coracana]
MRTGGDKKHGRLIIGDGTIDTASTPTLSQIRAKDPSTAPALRPWLNMAQMQVQQLEAQLTEERRLRHESEARQQTDMANLLAYLQTVHAQMGGSLPPPPSLSRPAPATPQRLLSTCGPAAPSRRDAWLVELQGQNTALSEQVAGLNRELGAARAENQRLLRRQQRHRARSGVRHIPCCACESNMALLNLNQEPSVEDEMIIDLNLPLDEFGAINMDLHQNLDGGFDLNLEPELHGQDDAVDWTLEQEEQDDVMDWFFQPEEQDDVMDLTLEQEQVDETRVQQTSKRKDMKLEVRKAVYQELLARSKNGRLGKNDTKEVAACFGLGLRSVQVL